MIPKESNFNNYALKSNSVKNMRLGSKVSLNMNKLKF